MLMAPEDTEPIRGRIDLAQFALQARSS